MPDETTEVAIQSTQDSAPAVPEFVDPGPLVIVVYDAEGREYYTSRTSPFAVKGLADGSLTYEPRPPVDNVEPTPPLAPVVPDPQTPEVPGGPEIGSADHDPEPGDGSGEGSGDETADPAPTRSNARRSSKA